jgi:hypothetical protein
LVTSNRSRTTNPTAEPPAAAAADSRSVPSGGTVPSERGDVHSVTAADAASTLDDGIIPGNGELPNVRRIVMFPI